MPQTLGLVPIGSNDFVAELHELLEIVSLSDSVQIGPDLLGSGIILAPVWIQIPRELVARGRYITRTSWVASRCPLLMTQPVIRGQEATASQRTHRFSSQVPPRSWFLSYSCTSTCCSLSRANFARVMPDAPAPMCTIRRGRLVP